MNYKKFIIETLLEAIKEVNPYNLIMKTVKLYGDSLKIKEIIIDLRNYSKVFVFSIGKAGYSMALGMENILKNRINRGIVLTKYGHSEKKLKYFEIIEAGHPLPDENSIIGAKKIYEIAKNADDKTLIINLISGGGSSLFTYPDFNLSLKEVREVTDILIKSGANIYEINCIRKHLSKVKGGKFAKICYPATVINLILSDVVGDRLDTIASGICAPDSTTFSDAFKIAEKYNLPHKIVKLFKKGINGEFEETPKKNDIIFKNVKNIIIGNNLSALKKVEEILRKNNIESLILTSHLQGEAREIAKFFAGITLDYFKNNFKFHPPFGLITGGETTVNVKGNGKGGRNQELVLAFTVELLKFKEYYKPNVYFVSIGTDGTDGPTDAAGAIFTPEIFNLIKKENLEVEKFLENNDSYNFFEKINHIIKTGPTHTNVCDIQILLLT